MDFFAAFSTLAMQFYPSFWRYRPLRNMFVGRRHGSSIIIFRSLRRRLDLFAQRQELASVFWECCGARIRLSRKSFSMLNYVAARSWKFFPKCIIHKKRYNAFVESFLWLAILARSQFSAAGNVSHSCHQIQMPSRKSRRSGCSSAVTKR